MMKAYLLFLLMPLISSPVLSQTTHLTQKSQFLGTQTQNTHTNSFSSAYYDSCTTLLDYFPTMFSQQSSIWQNTALYTDGVSAWDNFEADHACIVVRRLESKEGKKGAQTMGGATTTAMVASNTVIETTQTMASASLKSGTQTVAMSAPRTGSVTSLETTIASGGSRVGVFESWHLGLASFDTLQNIWVRVFLVSSSPGTPYLPLNTLTALIHCSSLQMVASLQSLPVELRLQIWDHYVRTSDLSIHQPRTFRRGMQRHLLAILQTCHTYRLEALPILTLDKFDFYCASTESLLDLLSNMSPMQLSLIRHLTVRDVPFEIHGDFFFWHDCFPLCPGLQLDTLTILDGGPSIHRQAPAVYFDIEQQVRAGCGWKQLRYLLNNTETMTFDHVWLGFSNFSRDPQPSTWSSIIQQRDNDLTGANVEIFVAKKEYAGLKRVVLDPGNREVFDNNAPEWNRPRQRLQTREMMVVLQRGKDAYIVEDGSGLKSSVSELFENMSWNMIKEEARRWRAVRGLESPSTEVDNFWWN
ncbi:hypothetical protein E2P81_ATG07728 [Venturia nashicola]|nr:hypothetical protein E2P81_ATG07728 [Venturia nashicola]